MANPIISKSTNSTTLEAAKITTAKSAAASIVTAMATDVTNGDFAAARKKAALLEKAYGELSQRRLP